MATQTYLPDLASSMHWQMVVCHQTIHEEVNVLLQTAYHVHQNATLSEPLVGEHHSPVMPLVSAVMGPQLVPHSFISTPPCIQRIMQR